MRHEVLVADAPAQAAPAPGGFATLSRTQMALVFALAWLFACAVLLFVNRHDIATLSYPDPDDKLRLVEVRDFILGQSWWDVGQHRINPPTGGTMHWSRIIDLPLAAVIVLLRPLLGYANAQLAAAIIVPMLTLGFTMAMVALLVRRLVGREAAFLGALLVTASPGALQQMLPLRVDHHGWQIGLAIAVMIALLDSNRRRSGAIAGAVLAMWLRISLEGLPLAAAAACLIGLRWAFAEGRSEDARLTAFFGALAGGSALLFIAFIPHNTWPIEWCDSISSAHIAMFGVGFIGSLGLAMLPPSRVLRIAAGGIVAAACLGTLHLGAPRCGLDAFTDIEPIVRKFWYYSVPEGLPLWYQSRIIVALALGYPLVGLAGGLLAWRHADGSAKDRWLAYLFMLIATIGATILVQRIGATANTLALGGGTWLASEALRRVRAVEAMPRRTLLTVATILAVAPVTPALAVAEIWPDSPRAEKSAKIARDCTNSSYYRALGLALPPARLFAPLDIGPAILLDSPHAVVATGHHRNHAAMADVIRGFLGSDATAHAIIARHGSAYVVICRDTAELQVYGHYAPHGFATELDGRGAPGWLRPVAVPGGGPLRAWRVMR
jgi:hypothetical protein